MRQLTQLFWMTVLPFIHTAALANRITLPGLAGMSINDKNTAREAVLTCLHWPETKTSEDGTLHRGGTSYPSDV